ncbi:GCN5 family acetyltransferase [Methanocalculus chunghsingensis]|uniref:GCN5 family acetyltransferase n=1 Tax=Methanocalculus chunghsingensis TaxID=156457 RepID=A0A8J7WB13_9EURY|nr:GCN5 family acetyltransferase [Methanocalculus chunghsingensis]
MPYLSGGAAEVREIRSDEFPDANIVWIDYHGTTGDPAVDRIFAACEGDAIVSLARCRRHPDGYEVDAVFTPEIHRGRGLSRQVMTALVEACYNDELTMYAVVHLRKFYGEYGFVPIPEGDLPASVRERYLWAAGNMEGAEVAPMRRSSGRPAILHESISINR